jgi:hypothetical protein
LKAATDATSAVRARSRLEIHLASLHASTHRAGTKPLGRVHARHDDATEALAALRVAGAGAQRAGTDGSARIGSAILYGGRAVTAWNLKPMGHCSIAKGSAATAWPGAHACTRFHQHACTSAHARTHTQDKGAGLSPGGGSARAHTPRRAKHSDCPVATNATNAALAPNQSAEVVDELDKPLPRLPCDACSTPTRPAKGSHRQWPVASQ